MILTSEKANGVNDVSSDASLDLDQVMSNRVSRRRRLAAGGCLLGTHQFHIDTNLRRVP